MKLNHLEPTRGFRNDPVDQLSGLAGRGLVKQRLIRFNA